MGSTPTYSFPYPEPEDDPDGPEQIGALASGVDTALKAHADNTTSVHGIPDTADLLSSADLAGYATDAEVASAVSAHSADTTGVHGIPDTADLVTGSDLDGLATETDITDAVSTHAADTTSVHGIANTAALETAAGSQAKADAALAAAIADAITKYLSLTGGTITGDLQVQGDMQARGAAAAETALEVRVTGDAFPRMVMRADGRMVFGDGTGAPATTGWYRDSSGNLTTNSFVAVGNGLQVDNNIVSWRVSPRALMAASTGGGIAVKEGADARLGVATLVGGTVTVNNASVTAETRIFLTCQTPGGTPGFLGVSARIAETSFTILSSSATDTSVVSWLLVEPAS